MSKTRRSARFVTAAAIAALLPYAAVPAASARHGGDWHVTERVSVADDGTPGNNPSFLTAVDADGSVVAFDSFASNLVPRDTNGAQDVFVRDRGAGDTERVSVASDGTQAQLGADDLTGSFAPAISADGQVVIFTSAASNLVPGDTNDSPGEPGTDVFARDRRSGVTELVSAAGDGGAGNRFSYTGKGSVSADGRYVAFTSIASDLVPGDSEDSLDVFVRDRQAGETTRVSVADDGTPGNGFSQFATISGDGRYVAFASEASNLVPGDDNGVGDVFLHDRQTRRTVRVSVASDGGEAGGSSSAPFISRDGSAVAFVSGAPDLVDGDRNGIDDVFVRDLVAGRTERVSVASDGSEVANDPFALFGFPSLSADGSVVVFDSSAQDLVADDTNQLPDAFVHDRRTGETTRVNVGPGGEQAQADPETGAGGVFQTSISDDATTVAFTSLAFDYLTGEVAAGSIQAFVSERVDTPPTEPVCTIGGTAGDDVLRGTAGDDVICAGAGNDRVLAGAGDDLVFAGAGDDVVFGQAGDDRLVGAGGHDRLSGGPGGDHVQGDAGRDALRGGRGDDRLWGGGDGDRLGGGRGADDLRGGQGRDRLAGGAGDDTVYGDRGDDRLAGNRGGDLLHGSQGDDVMRGGAGSDVCNGAADRDVAFRCERVLNVP